LHREPTPAPTVRILRRLALVEPGEVRALLLAAGFFFCVLSSYYVIRPVRDEMGVLGGVRNLAWLFSGTLAVTLLIHPLFAGWVSRLTRARFIPLAYRGFALSLVGFYLLLEAVPEDLTIWVGRAFFVWTSVFNLFVISVFWGFMADIFSPEQARRLFGFIAVGGSLGAIAGAALSAALATLLGPVTLLLLSAALLEAAVRCAALLGRAAPPAPSDEPVERSPAPPALAAGPRSEKPIGGTSLDGIRRVLRTPFLASICLFIGFLTLGSTFLYFQQAEIFARELSDSAERTALFARVDLVVNVLTLIVQLFLTGRLLRWLGVGAGLALLPLVSLLGFATLAAMPVLGVVVVLQVLRRVTNFAVTRPSREVLFTVLPRADKYKAKNFIDTFIYRLGDQVGAWGYTLLTAVGLGVAGTALVAAPLAGVWMINAFLLARRYEALAARRRGGGLPDPALAPAHR
jgi:ATP:ADP antiporter, AAA family